MAAAPHVRIVAVRHTGMVTAITSAAVDAAWRDAWDAFLSNRIEIAYHRAAPLVQQLLPAALDAAARADGGSELDDALVTLADMAHVAGAAAGDAQMLEQAIAAYDAHLRRCPRNRDAMRMRAETLLRCRRTARAFEAFGELHEATLADGAPATDSHTSQCPVKKAIHAPGYIPRLRRLNYRP